MEAGTKVILGENRDGFSLVCTRTKDGRAINRYVSIALGLTCILYAERALWTGAQGYLPKGRATRDLLDAIRVQVFDGRCAPFRCFQPLDHVRLNYRERETGLIVETLSTWGSESPAPKASNGYCAAN